MVLQRLRVETRTAHEQLESNIDLLGRKWTNEFYRQLLEKFYGFYSIIEPSIWERVQWELVGIDAKKRRKTNLLVQDLKVLGLNCEEIMRLPQCAKVPIVETFSQALGCAYVLEGSTLGGQVITRHLRRELGIESERGASFFTSYGSEVGPMWRDFTNILNTEDLSQEDEDLIVHYACKTFGAFDNWLHDLL